MSSLSQYRSAVVLAGMITVLAQAQTNKAERAFDQFGLILPANEHQLFLDDFVLGDLYRVKRVIHQPKKYEGNPIILPDRPTDGLAIQTRDAPIWDEQERVWKLWYIRFSVDGNGAGGAGYARFILSGSNAELWA